MRRARRRALGCGLGVQALLLLCPAGVQAQGADCATLRAEIQDQAADQARPGQWSTAARQQSYEIERTRTYYASIGCNDGLDVGEGETAQCQAIATRIARMQDNLDRLRAQAQDNADEERHRALVEEYNNQCMIPAPAPAPDPAEEPLAAPRALPPADSDTPSIMDSPPSEAEPQLPESKVLCVRQCDGGFFPIAYKARADQLEGLGKLCQALCPNAQVELFTARPDQDIDKAVAADGLPYTSLPAAFKFQKVFDPTCSCKPPNQSWAEALAAAEAMIDHGKNDVTVTPALSAAMARPIFKPIAPADAAPASKAAAATRPAHAARRAKPPAAAAAAADDAPSDPGQNIMREIRPTAPTL